jgi:hypothetical protein
VDGVIISGPEAHSDPVVNSNPVGVPSQRTKSKIVAARIMVLGTVTPQDAAGSDHLRTATDRASAGHRILPAAGAAGDNHGSRP